MPQKKKPSIAMRVFRPKAPPRPRKTAKRGVQSDFESKKRTAKQSDELTRSQKTQRGRAKAAQLRRKLRETQRQLDALEDKQQSRKQLGGNPKRKFNI